MNRRSDYTFKYNKGLGRHGWLRLTPAYSVKLVREALSPSDLFSDCAYHGGLILDPFSGTATTGLVAAEMGLDCALYDINPFLVWLGRVKASNYDAAALERLYESTVRGLRGISTQTREEWLPPMKNIDRWWSQSALSALSRARAWISDEYGAPADHGEGNLLWVAFARLVMETSAADFGHVSVSFKKETASYHEDAIVEIFKNILRAVIDSAKKPLQGNVTVTQGDSRKMDGNGRKFDFVITSPPYPNRMSYIRELRPYMYWLGFLESGEQAGDMDWQAIGGTWGAATSRLLSWEKSDADLPDELLEICHKIESSDGKNGKTMSRYVLKFFCDMKAHFASLRGALNIGASVNYILGNSSFYGNYVRADAITKEIMRRLGYANINSRVIRKRNCDKGLFEYSVTATA